MPLRLSEFGIHSSCHPQHSTGKLGDYERLKRWPGFSHGRGGAKRGDPPSASNLLRQTLTSRRRRRTRTPRGRVRHQDTNLWDSPTYHDVSRRPLFHFYFPQFFAESLLLSLNYLTKTFGPSSWNLNQKSSGKINSSLWEDNKTPQLELLNLNLINIYRRTISQADQ